MKKIKICVLGATGSIGEKALDLIRQNQDFVLHSFSGWENQKRINEIIKEFSPKKIAFSSSLKNKIKTNNCFYDAAGLDTLASDPDVDFVFFASSSISSLKAIISAIENKKRIAIANKEILVVAGEMIMRKAEENNITIIPVDSEHSAIFQCIEKENKKNIKRLIITGSGGPFLNWSKKKMKNATVSEALNHPKWQMGKKVSIDSATMMNKGLELIEAHHLFKIPVKNIEILIHRESIIHSMVEYCDNSLIAQMSNPDMHIPIQFALNFPQRKKIYGTKSLDFSELKKMTFKQVDYKKFPCLKLALKAITIGKSMPIVLNVANEIAVENFLQEKITFEEIPLFIEKIMNQHQLFEPKDINEIILLDNSIRTIAKGIF